MFLDLRSLNFEEPLPLHKEGLPYWTFWLLICIILLLVVFIFLRDKDLRRRLNFFFFGVKRKLLQIRLQAKLNKEKKKKKKLIQELGEKVWLSGAKLEKKQNIYEELHSLEKRKTALIQERVEIQAKIDSLKSSAAAFKEKYLSSIRGERDAKKLREEKRQEVEKSLQKINEEAYPEERKTEKEKLQKEKQEGQKGLEELQKRIKSLEFEMKAKSKEFEKEIKHWESEKAKLEGRLLEIERQKIPLFEHLGESANEARIEEVELSLFYSQIDRCQRHIQKFKAQIDKL